MSIKNKIAPVYFQYDILDTEMPECFFDKLAMTHMFFYELMDQDENGIKLDTLMIDENSKENYQFNMNFYGKVLVLMEFPTFANGNSPGNLVIT